MTTKSTQKPAMTDVEQQEYVQHLQSGRTQVPQDNPLEAEACKRLREISQGIQQLNDARNRADKQLTSLQNQIRQLDNQINRESGELNAYASLLISAEEKRRGSAGNDSEAEKAVPPTTTGETDTETTSTPGTESAPSKPSSCPQAIDDSTGDGHNGQSKSRQSKPRQAKTKVSSATN